MEIGERVRKLRKEKGISMRELADRSDVSNSYLSQLETGRNNKPTVDFVQKLAKGLNVDYITLLEETTIDNPLADRVRKAERTTPDVVNVDEFMGNLARGFAFNRDFIMNNRTLTRYEAQFFGQLFLSVAQADPMDFTVEEWNHVIEEIERMLKIRED